MNPDLDDGLHGSGVINALEVLQAQLPSSNEVDAYKKGVEAVYEVFAETTGPDSSFSVFGVSDPVAKSSSAKKQKPGLLRFNNVFRSGMEQPKINNKPIKEVLCNLFDVKEKGLADILEQCGNELSFLLIQDEDLRELFDTATRKKALRSEENIHRIRSALLGKELSRKLWENLV